MSQEPGGGGTFVPSEWTNATSFRSMILTRYQWCTKYDNCDLCNMLAGQVHTLDTWSASGVWPGFHIGCDCYMKPVSVEVPLSDADIFGSDLDTFLEIIRLINIFPLDSILFDQSYIPFAWQQAIKISDAAAQHPDWSIGQVLRDLKEKFSSGMWKSSFWSKLFPFTKGFNILKSVIVMQNIDDSYCGYSIPIEDGVIDMSGRSPGFNIPFGKHVVHIGSIRDFYDPLISGIYGRGFHLSLPEKGPGAAAVRKSSVTYGNRGYRLPASVPHFSAYGRASAPNWRSGGASYHSPAFSSGRSYKPFNMLEPETLKPVDPKVTYRYTGT